MGRPWRGVLWRCLGWMLGQRGGKAGERSAILLTRPTGRWKGDLALKQTNTHSSPDSAGLALLMLVLLAFLAVTLLFFGSGWMHVDVN